MIAIRNLFDIATKRLGPKGIFENNRPYNGALQILSYLKINLIAKGKK